MMRVAKIKIHYSKFTINYFLFLLLVVGCRETTGSEGSTPEPTARVEEPLAIVNTPSQPTVSPTPTQPARSVETQNLASLPATTPTPPPTTTPHILATNAVLDYADSALHDGKYLEAIQLYSELAQGELGNDGEIYLNMGIAYKEEGVLDQAEQAFGIAGQLSLANDDVETQAQSQFFLAETYRLDGRCPEAISMYEAYLKTDETLRGYVVPRIALCQSLLGGIEVATDSLQSVEDVDIHYLALYQNRLALGQLYEVREMTVEAAEIYEKIALDARTDYTFSQMLYKAGVLNIQNGEEERGYAKLQAVYAGYFKEPFAHDALRYLLENEQEIDQLRRAVVNYEAGVYAPCVEAFEAAFSAGADASESEYAYAYYPDLAECYEGIGDFENAERWMFAYLDEVEARLATPPYVNSQFKTMGDFYRRNGQDEVALDYYSRVLGDRASTDVQERWRAEQAAESYVDLLTELGRLEEAEAVALDFAEKYNAVNRNTGEMVSAEILHDLAMTAYQSGETDIAQRVWTRGTELALQQYSYATAILQNKINGTDLTELPLETAYYSIRHNELFAGETAFQRQTGGFPTENTDRIDAILFMQERNATLGFATDLMPDFMADAGFVRGMALWELREYDLAKREFEAFNLRFQEDGSPLERLVLSETYRDIGFYNGSIRVAIDLIVEAGENIFTAPPYLARLAYPIYYADLIEAEAAEQGLDPYLVTAMIRQESLFESFATSSAVAQGLAQVIPDTGVYIAQQLGDTAFENEDLFKPVVGVAYGAYYLRQQIGFFDGSIHAGLAAYNAGPGNAQFWFDEAGDDLDLFVETIGFDETEQYVKRIYSGYTIYKHLYLGE